MEYFSGGRSSGKTLMMKKRLAGLEVDTWIYTIENGKVKKLNRKFLGINKMYPSIYGINWWNEK
jgi:type IV secretory pathway ATPase VirB11/archaellum biosynthesis ATPase